MLGSYWTVSDFESRQVPRPGADHLLLVDHGAPLAERLAADARIRALLAEPGHSRAEDHAACPNARYHNSGRDGSSNANHAAIYYHYARCVRPLIRELAGTIDLDTARRLAATDPAVAAALALYDTRPYQLEEQVPVSGPCNPYSFRTESRFRGPDPFAAWYDPTEVYHVILDDPTNPFPVRAAAAVAARTERRAHVDFAAAGLPQPPTEDDTIPGDGSILIVPNDRRGAPARPYRHYYALECPLRNGPAVNELPFYHDGVCATRLLIDEAPRFDPHDAALVASLFDLMTSENLSVRVSGGDYETHDTWLDVATRLYTAADTIADPEAKKVFTAGIDDTVHRIERSAEGHHFYGEWRSPHWPPPPGWP